VRYNIEIEVKMTHYQLITKNKRKSWLVMIIFIIFVLGSSYIISYGFGYGLDVVAMALIIAGVMSFSSYWWSDKMILGISGAKPANRQEYFDFYTVAENIVSGQRMPMPKLYVINDTAMNAFATGRDPRHAAVVATTGLLQNLTRSEIEGVVAHELSHVQNYDIRLMSIVTILVGMIALLADMMLRMSAFGGGRRRDDGGGQFQIIFFAVGLILVLLSPLIAKLIQLAVSRSREFLADASAVQMTRNPAGLINALQKISTDTEPLEAANKATAHLYFTNPLKNHQHDGISWFAKLFQTHPPISERIAALKVVRG